MKYSTVLVDIDDTILDTQRNSKEAFMEIFESHHWNNYFESFDQFYASYTPSNIQLWSLYAQGKLQKEELIVQRFLIPLSPYFQINEQQAKELNNELLLRVSEKTGLIEHAKEMLDYLAPNYQLVILSNGFKEVQYKKLSSAGLDGYFQHVILSDEAGVNKPHPGIFTKALTLANSQKTDTIMLGDSFESDICGAKNSGIDQIWFNPENNTQSEDFTPTYMVEKLEEIKNIL